MLHNEDESPQVKRTGPVWLINPENGEAYLGDVSQCTYGCSFNTLCGTESQCKERMNGQMKLIIFVSVFIACCALCAIMGSIEDCCLRNDQDNTSHRSNSFRKHSFQR